MVSLSTSCFMYENEKLLKFLFLVMMAKEKPPITVVGDVGGRIAIIVVRYTFLSYSSKCFFHAIDIRLLPVLGLHT